MTHHDLLERLERANIPADAYTLYENPRDETLTIQYKDGLWTIYYYERGLYSGLHKFPNRTDAEEYFFNEIVRWFKK